MNTMPISYQKGYEAGYQSIRRDVQKCMPSDPADAAQYEAGFKKGLSEGLADAEFERAEQAFYDWQAGL